MKRQAEGNETKPVRAFQNARRHLRRATEFSREGPFGARAVAQHAAKHLRPRRRAGHLFDFGLAIHREQAHAKFKGALDVAFLLDRIAIADAVRARARRQHLLDLDDRSGVETGAKTRQQFEDSWIGVGLHGVEHAGVGQRLGEGRIIVANGIEVEDQTRPILAAVAEKFQNTIGHRGIPSKGADFRAGTNKLWVNGDAAWVPALWRRDRFG